MRSSPRLFRSTASWCTSAPRTTGRAKRSSTSPRSIRRRRARSSSAGAPSSRKAIVEISDAAADPHYDPNSVITGHWRRMLGVPMLREGEPLGALVVAWREPGETPRRQVELLQTFADQAAIAIENVRLFNETKEALEQQTAIGEILRVICRFDDRPGSRCSTAILANATRALRGATVRRLSAARRRRFHDGAPCMARCRADQWRDGNAWFGRSADVAAGARSCRPASRPYRGHAGR